jgi:hypothetical protein
MPNSGHSRRLARRLMSASLRSHQSSALQRVIELGLRADVRFDPDSDHGRTAFSDSCSVANKLGSIVIVGCPNEIDGARVPGDSRKSSKLWQLGFDNHK